MMRQTVRLGTLERIWRYPIKSLRGEELYEAAVDEEGILGDRRRALCVTSAHHPRSGKTYRGKEDERLHLVDVPAQAADAARARGVEVEERADGPFFDAAPVSLMLSAWLDDLEGFLGRRLDPRRFRPNFYVIAEGGAPREGDLVGATIHLGHVALRVLKPTVRCVTPTYDVATGASSPEVLRVLAEKRESSIGLYCAVESGGTVARGLTVCADLPAHAPA